jgi:hypothetical protein
VLPNDTVEIAVRFARDYDDWWETTPWRLRGRARLVGGGDASAWQDGDGADLVRLPLQAGKNYVLEFETAEANGAKFNGIRTWPISVEAAPAQASPGLIVFTTMLTLALVILVPLDLSRAFRVAVLRALGRRWTFLTSESAVTIEGRPRGDAIELTAAQGGAVEVRRCLPLAVVSAAIRQGREDFGEIRDALLPPTEGRLQTISIRVPEVLFHYALGLKLVGGWAPETGPHGLPELSRVCGQTAILQEVRARPPSRLARVRFAGVAFAGEPLLSVDAEIPPIEGTFRRLHAEVLNCGSRCGDLLAALRNADVVHVAAHATLSEIELEDGSFTAAWLPDEILDQVRCRLVILSACEAGRTSPDRSSVAWALIRAGVNLIGSTEPLDDTVARRFFPMLYERFLPVRAGEGPALAEAIRHASIDFAAAFATCANTAWRDYLNLLVLYGNPNLRLGVFHPRKD